VTVLKLARNANSDGLINWLNRARIEGVFQVASQSGIVIDPRLPFATRTNSRSV